MTLTGKQLRARRKELGLTQSEMAERMGLARRESIVLLEKQEKLRVGKILDAYELDIKAEDSTEELLRKLKEKIGGGIERGIGKGYKVKIVIEEEKGEKQ